MIYNQFNSNRKVMKNNNIPFYALAIGIFILLKYTFKYADNNDLFFILKPTDKVIELITNTQSTFNINTGFYHEKLNIIIDRSCSGFNFLTLNFLILSYLGLNFCRTSTAKLIVFPSALLLSYLFTIFVNAARIFVSIVVYNLSKNILNDQQHLIHEAVGIITDLSFLIFIYVIIVKLLKNSKYFEEYS